MSPGANAAYRARMPERDTARALLARQALDLRDKAEQYRSAAEGTRNHVAKDALLNLARDSDRMAATIEAQVTGLARGLGPVSAAAPTRPRA